VTASELLQALADGEDIHLSLCTITGTLDVNRLFDPNEKFETGRLNTVENPDCRTITFGQSLVFDKCVFEDNTVFAAPWSQPDCLCVEFEQDVIFNSSQFQGQARFRNATFRGTAGFDGCVFGGVATFKNARVHGDAKFRTAVFNSYALLGGIEFKSSARFTNTHFVKGVNFTGARFRGQVDFSGVYSSSRAVPAADGVTFDRSRYGEDESFWRFVKQSAQEAGHYQLAGEYFYRERCANLSAKLRGRVDDTAAGWRKAARHVLAVRFLPELVFGRLLFGYGERPVRVLVASALIILVCGAFYAQPGALAYRGVSGGGSFFEGLYFSTITFTTLGYGDLYPSPSGYYRLLAMSEAVAGGCLMALFIVCLAKRFSRG